MSIQDLGSMGALSDEKSTTGKEISGPLLDLVHTAVKILQSVHEDLQIPKIPNDCSSLPSCFMYDRHLPANLWAANPLTSV